MLKHRVGVFEQLRIFVYGFDEVDEEDIKANIMQNGPLHNSPKKKANPFLSKLEVKTMIRLELVEFRWNYCGGNCRSDALCR